MTSRSGSWRPLRSARLALTMKGSSGSTVPVSASMATLTMTISFAIAVTVASARGDGIEGDPGSGVGVGDEPGPPLLALGCWNLRELTAGIHSLT
jgi:hypothetical protein